MQRTMRKTTYVWLAATGVCFLLVTLWRPDSHKLMAANQENLTKPLPGLKGQPLIDFNTGLDEFEEKETPEDGLGPLFNGTSCADCHSVPSVGGSEPNVGVARETRIGRRFNGRFDPLDGSVPGSVNSGGGLLQQRAIDLPGCKQLQGEVVPQEATIVSLRNTTALFGLGLVEAIPAKAIEDNINNNPMNNRGKANIVLDPDDNQMKLGRFGWKAQVATLHQFAGDAYLNEMGITNPSFPHENLPQGKPIPPGCDLKPEPPAPAKCDKTSCEDDGSGVTAFANFMKFLAPAPRRPITNQVQRGEQVFSNDTTVGGIECARCHVPTMTTGSNDVEELNGKPVNLYSDLLLHDIGTDDGIEQGLAKGTDFRTALLWGLSRRDRFMHDAKSNTIEDAILRHGGNSPTARENFEKLSLDDRAALLAFLGSL